nr:hypothetical protein [uncultured Blautia sp.]
MKNLKYYVDLEKTTDDEDVGDKYDGQMLYSQIVLKKGMPFELKLPSSKPLAVGAMTREELDAELQKGVDSIKAGKVYSADEVDAALAKEFIGFHVK